MTHEKKQEVIEVIEVEMPESELQQVSGGGLSFVPEQIVAADLPVVGVVPPSGGFTDVIATAVPPSGGFTDKVTAAGNK